MQRFAQIQIPQQLSFCQTPAFEIQQQMTYILTLAEHDSERARQRIIELRDCNAGLQFCAEFYIFWIKIEVADGQIPAAYEVLRTAFDVQA